MKTYIEDNINGNLNNEVLARKAGMSAGCFGRVFKHYYDCTPARYVLEMRIREASQLLLQSEESLDAIAEATGFPNRAYFSRVFKKIVKVPPAAFRRNARG
ncbi:MAG: AraC family transcriptional regulator [Kiritimatiellae bacterium]|nr:AraC family transcriptional regulator [Kiritimatiellia bacterium]